MEKLEIINNLVKHVGSIFLFLSLQTFLKRRQMTPVVKPGTERKNKKEKKI